MPHDPLTQVEDLLARSRKAILQAEFDNLPPLAAATEAAMAMLSPRTEPDRLLRLRGQAADNARLARAAAEGIRAARARLAALLSPEPLTTYDRQGRRAELPACPPHHERRA